MTKKVTLQDIAKELNLSISTIHRSINRMGNVKSDVSDMVLDKAVEMGYVFPRSFANGSKKFTIAFLCPQNEFFADVIRGVRYASQRYASFGLCVEERISDQNSVAVQAEQLRQLLAGDIQSYAGLVITPSHSVLLNPLLQRIADHGVKIITINNDAPDSGRISFVGENPDIAAQTAALLYQRFLKQDATVATMSSHLATLGLQKRTKVFIDEMERAGKQKMLGTIEYMDQVDTAYEVATQVLENLQPDAIFTNSMHGAIGCAKAIEELDEKRKVLLVGFDLCPQVIEYLKKDIMFATISQEPFSQGYQAVKLLVQLQLNPQMHLDDTYHTQTDIIFKTNLRRNDINVSF